MKHITKINIDNEQLQELLIMRKETLQNIIEDSPGTHRSKEYSYRIKELEWLLTKFKSMIK